MKTQNQTDSDVGMDRNGRNGRSRYGMEMTPLMTSPAERRVLCVALASRAAMTLLSVVTAMIVTPYDTSTRLQRVPPLLAAFANWDGVFFTHIATSGYDYEHVHAFFPLYPLLVRLCSRLLPVSASLAVPLAGWAISNACFVLAALYLYRLGRLELDSEPLARRAAFLFCVAPSSVFMTAIYSESLMCLLSFAGLFYLEIYRRSHAFTPLFTAAALFGGASATRSNGALLSLYIAWRRLRESPWPLTHPLHFLWHWLVTALLGVVAVGPQVLYFVQAIRVYCPSLMQSLVPALASTARNPLVTQDRPWCDAVVPNISAMYMFIQREYWNVGFLRYYEWKQVPNFLLAAPILLLTGYSLVRFLTTPLPKPLKSSLGPYMVHWGFMFINALLVAHIQVTTRLLAACPPLFWAPAIFFFNDASRAQHNPTQQPKPSVVPVMGRAVVAYFLVYCVLGAGLFSSFYPWT